MTSDNQNLNSGFVLSGFGFHFSGTTRVSRGSHFSLLLEITLSQQGVPNMSIESLRLCFSHCVHLVFRVASHAGTSRYHGYFAVYESHFYSLAPLTLGLDHVTRSTTFRDDLNFSLDFLKIYIRKMCCILD